MPRRYLGKTDGTRLYMDQWPALADRAEQDRVTVSDVVRDAIDAHLGRPLDPPDLRARLVDELVAVIENAANEWKEGAQ